MSNLKFILFSTLLLMPCIAANSTNNEKTYNETVTGFLPGLSCIPPSYYDNFSKHYCNRKCIPGEPPRICHYILSLTTFETHHPQACSSNCNSTKNCHECLKTDGVRSNVLVYNRQLPGPSIVVCKGDYVIVDIANHIRPSNPTAQTNVLQVYQNFLRIFQNNNVPYPAICALRETLNYIKASLANSHDNCDPTTVHFHGILHQLTIQNDGVTGVTQNLIPCGYVYRSKFIADPEGTLFYHSHYVVQRAFGASGRLTVLNALDPHAKLYDYDVTTTTIMVKDLMYNLTVGPEQNMVLNEKGLTQDGQGGAPLVIAVEPKKTYRFRIIANIINNCKVVLWIKYKCVKVIAVDGTPVNPQEVCSIMLAPAERIDFIINFGNYSEKPFYLHAMMFCRTNQFHQIGIIQFRNAPNDQWSIDEFNDRTLPEGPQLAFPNLTTISDPSLATSSNHLKGVKKLPSQLNGPCINISILQTVSAAGFKINNISNRFPSTAFQIQAYKYGKLNTTNICNSKNVTDFCEHLVELKADTCYQMAIIGQHPFHLHGHHMYPGCIGHFGNMSATPESVDILMKEGKVKCNWYNPPARDVIFPHLNGFIVVRVFFNNRGFIASHCHIDPHTEAGMFVIFQVGDVEGIVKIRDQRYNAQVPAYKNNLCLK